MKSTEFYDAVIVGAGAAGLAAAGYLYKKGISNLVVLEREQEPGGVPRHSHHHGFGLEQYRIPYRGPTYVKRLMKECAAVPIQTQTTVCQLHPRAELTIASETGLSKIKAKAVLLSTGIRESSGASQLISSKRPWGMFTTGSIQQFWHFTKSFPFKNPAIIGSEWVSYSVVLTLKNAGIKPVAMIEENPTSTAPYWLEKFASIGLRIPIHKHAKVVRILGSETVAGIHIESQGKLIDIDCDAVIFTGKFLPEASLAMASHLLWDPRTQGPLIDQYWRCSDHSYFAAGNVLRAVETSGIAALEGISAAKSIVASLKGNIQEGEPISVQVETPLEYVYPQRIYTPGQPLTALQLRARMQHAAKGRLQLICNGKLKWQKTINSKALQRICFPANKINTKNLSSLTIKFKSK